MTQRTESFLCGICSKSVTDDCIECSICCKWIHRSCTKLTKVLFKQIGSDNSYWFCKFCEEVFPFHNISNSDLSCNLSISSSLCEKYDLYEKCSIFNFETFNYSEFRSSDFEQNIDPDNNFFNNIQNSCNYYTDEQFIKKFKQDKSLSVIHFNARSLKANIYKIKDYINKLKHEFDIITISETWLDLSSNMNDVQLSGYNFFHVNRTVKRGGGVAVYIRNHLKCKLIKELSMSVDGFYDQIFVELLMEKSKNIVIGCFYRAPGSPLEIFNESLDSCLNSIVSKKVIYICGDFNVDILKSDTHPGTRYFVDTMFNLGLFPLINKPSRVTESTTTLIDNIFTNDLVAFNLSGLLVNDISDHLPIFLFSQYISSKNKPKQFKVIRKVKDESIMLMKKDLAKQDWNVVCNCNDINLAYGYFIDIFMNIYNKHCPLVKVCVNQKYNDKPWFTTSLKNACRKKNTLYLKFLKCRSSEANQRYKKYKNKFHTEVLRKKIIITHF